MKNLIITSTLNLSWYSLRLCPVFLTTEQGKGRSGQSPGPAEPAGAQRSGAPGGRERGCRAAGGAASQRGGAAPAQAPRPPPGPARPVVPTGGGGGSEAGPGRAGPILPSLPAPAALHCAGGGGAGAMAAGAGGDEVRVLQNLRGKICKCGAAVGPSARGRRARVSLPLLPGLPARPRCCRSLPAARRAGAGAAALEAAGRGREREGAEGPRAGCGLSAGWVRAGCGSGRAAAAPWRGFVAAATTRAGLGRGLRAPGRDGGVSG